MCSHWFLNALVHVAELPLAGPGSPLVGLGLWRNLPVALAVEGGILTAGTCAFVRRGGAPRWRAFAIGGCGALALARTVIGMTAAPAPPSVTAMASTSLLTVVVVCGSIYWLASALHARASA